jgi:precorrin-6B methylase 2
VTDPAVHAETEVGLVPGLRTRTDAEGRVWVDTPSGIPVDAGLDGFAILSLFEKRGSLGSALAQLRGRPDSIAAAAVVMSLVETGAIVDAATLGARKGWADPVEHAWMLHDRRRTDAYLVAIRTIVRPGDTVLDIGTGSGILAVAAAKAGAAHVYAVEATEIADVAADIFRANGVQDRIELIRAWSTDVDLPRRADVLVSEIIGTEPLEEDILEITLDARRRLLQPGARLIPSALTLSAQPLHVPDVERHSSAIDPEPIHELERRYGVDLSPLIEARPRPIGRPTIAAWLDGRCSGPRPPSRPSTLRPSIQPRWMRRPTSASRSTAPSTHSW